MQTYSFRLCKKCFLKLKEYEPGLLLETDSICYGCQYYSGDGIECTPPDICVEGSMNTSKGGVMTLEEAIKHAKEVSEKASFCDCKEEHMQLAKWLKKLQRLEDIENDLKECIKCLKESIEENAEIDDVWLSKLEEKYLQEEV